ncbi:MAG: hypothetical protein ABI823_12815 [Bryobacteraceae bacterium]
MDLTKLLRELRAERDQLDQAIAALEKVDGGGPGLVAAPKRRGRRSMSAAERRAVSERMQRYWAKRKDGSESDAT